MSQSKLQAAQELMLEEHYTAARILLSTIGDDPAALRLLDQLNELTGDSRPFIQWEYSELSWRMIGFVEGIPDSYSPADAVLHRFALIVHDYADLNPNALELSSIDFRVGRNLGVYTETDTSAFRSRFHPDAQDFEKLFREQREAFRALQPVILRELNQLLEIAVRTHLMRLGADGWELIAVRDRKPEVWLDLHELVRQHIEELCSVYYLKRRIA
ncbi:MAG: hypothetical protein KC519_10760 [Anaerolineae bacterium]|nr:hypothetical protein [Anaerolineae bacterium]